MSNPFNSLRRQLWRRRDLQRIAIGLGKGAAMAMRRIDPADPQTWEWSAFSQNGEDGILDVLRSHLHARNRYFLEIGASDGIANNTAWLATSQNYAGLMVEGSPERNLRARQLRSVFAVGVECLHRFVTRDNVAELVARMLYRDPDVCSIDIDGNDFYVTRALLDAGLRPKIVVVEYNSAYGPEARTTIAYAEAFRFTTAHPTQLYYGVSVAGWRAFFEARGYRFVTVDGNGVNAFFVDATQCDSGFLDGIRGLAFVENRFQMQRFREPWQAQFERIRDMAFTAI